MMDAERFIESIRQIKPGAYDMVAGEAIAIINAANGDKFDMIALAFYTA